jgi:aminopeptidase-like protein
MQSIVKGLENNLTPKALHNGEPQLGRRDLYPSQAGMVISQDMFYGIWDFLAYADGATDLLEICRLTGLSIEDGCQAQELLLARNLITVERHYRRLAGALPPAKFDGAINRPNRSFFAEVATTGR